MRIISGRLKGRQFSSPRGNRTHPMSDKMRGALFNTLGDIDGLTVLDAFAGSGAIAFEAISRGAGHATAIDADRKAQAAIAANIKELGLADSVKPIKANAASWLQTSQDSFDIVIVDPPWEDPQLGLLARLADRTEPGGIFVISIGKETQLDLPGEYELLAQNAYGDGYLTFYRRS